MFDRIESTKQNLKSVLEEALGEEHADLANKLVGAVDSLIEAYIWKLEDELKYTNKFNDL